MNDPMVIVDAVRIDAVSENIQLAQTDHNVWVYRLPQDAGELAKNAFSRLLPQTKDLVHTVIMCSAADDSFARYRCVTSDRCRPRDVTGALGINLTMILGRYFHKLQNAFKVDAACASSLVALEIADLLIRKNQGIVLISAIDKSTSPHFLGLFRNIGALSQDPTGYKGPFDKNRSGFVMGEGAGLLAVTTKSTAKKLKLPIIAEINAIGTCAILTHPTSPSDPVLLEQFIQDVIISSGINIEDFAYWDAHATATPDGDASEFEIFKKIFKNYETALSSYKGSIGHTMAASAAIEIINAVEHLQQGTIPSTDNLFDPLDSDVRLITKSISTDKKIFLKTSFGFGGRNGAAVITVY
jgi:3-oxoacyl-(acyl-carrier-protein) synthase